MQSGSSLDKPHDILSYLGCQKISHPYRVFTSTITSNTKPTSYIQASKYLEWREAMQKEIQALQDNNTSTITTLLSNIDPIGCKWIYKIKYRSDGSIGHYKIKACR